MKWFCRVVSAVLFLCSCLILVLAFILHDHDLYLYEEVAHALSYAGIILFGIFISIYLIRDEF